MATLKEIKDCFKPGIPKRLADWFARYLKDVIDEEDEYNDEELDVDKSALQDLLEAGDETYGTIGDAFIGGLHLYKIKDAYQKILKVLSEEDARAFLEFYFSDGDLVSDFTRGLDEEDIQYYADFLGYLGYPREWVYGSTNPFVIKNGVLVRYTGDDDDIVIPEGVTRIGREAFAFFRTLRSVVIPSGVTRIEKFAFDGCDSLTKVTFEEGSKLTHLGYGAFLNCGSLQNIALPVGLKVIGDTSLAGCTSLSSVELPNGLTSVEDEAFYGDTSLKSVTIPNSVTNIGSRAFGWCDALSKINYLGTRAQWAAVNKGDSWNEHVENLSIHCTDGDIEKDEVDESLNKEKQVRESFNDISLKEVRHLFEKFSR